MIVHHLGMVKEVLQTKEQEAQIAWAAKKARDPKDPELGAKLFGNMPGLARYMPEGLREFRIELMPGAQPVRQGPRRLTAEETAEITKQVDKMLRALLRVVSTVSYADGTRCAPAFSNEWRNFWQRH